MEIPQSRKHRIGHAICDLHREARINVVYYGWRLKNIRWWANAFDVAIAVSMWATAGSVAAFSKPVAGSMALIGGLLTVVKSSLELDKKVEQFSKLWAAYNGVFCRTEKLVLRIDSDRDITGDDISAFDELQTLMHSISREDEVAPDNGMLKAAQEAIRQEIPADTLWCPPEKSEPISSSAYPEASAV